MDCDHEASCSFSHFVRLCQQFKAPEPEPEIDLRSIPAERLAEYKDAFTVYDEDRDGKLNRWVLI